MPASVTVSWAPSTRFSTRTITYQLQYRFKTARLWINDAIGRSPATKRVVTNLVAGALYEFRHYTYGSGWTEISVPTEIRVGVPPTPVTKLKVSQ